MEIIYESSWRAGSHQGYLGLLAAASQLLLHPGLRLDDSATDLPAGMVNDRGQEHRRRPEPRRIRRILFGADPRQPTHLLPNQLDGGRSDPLRADEPAVDTPAPSL